MILQSQNDVIRLLPALPESWPEGSVSGLRARGACTVNINWKEGLLSKVKIKSDKGGTYLLKYKEASKEIVLKAGEEVVLDSSLN